MKRVLSIFLAVLTVFSLAIPSVFAAPAVNTGKYPAGTVIPAGNWYDVYQSSGAEVFAIDTAEDLIAFAESADDFLGKTVVLTADITLPSSHNWIPKRAFSGTFDGNGFAIKGLSSKTTDTGTVDANQKPVYTNAGGLVYQLNGTIKNLSLLDCNITVTANNPDHAGIFAGNAGGAVLYNCYTNGKLTTNRTNVAGMVGHMNGTLSITNCHFDGTVTATASYSGGFVGNQESNPLYMMDCLNTGTVTGTANFAAFSDSVYNGLFLAYRCVNMGKVSKASGALAPSMGTTVGSALSSATAALAVTEHYAKGGATRGSATYTDCYSLEGSSDDTYYNLRSHSAVNGIGPLPEGAHDALTDEQKAELAKVVKTFTKKDYADMLEVLGSAWTIDAKGNLALSKLLDNDNTSVFISTYDQLVAWAKDPSDDEGKTIVLTADIVANIGDASAWGASAPAKVWTSKSVFAGTFDGNGHSISGLYGDALVESLQGGVIKDLSIVNTYVKSNSQAGTFADKAKDSRIEGCYTDAILKGDTAGTNLGGIVGTLGGLLTVENTWFDGVVDSQGRYVGGFVGNQESFALILKDCLNTGSVTGWRNAAGFSDAVYGGLLFATRCVNLGKVTVIAQDRASSAKGPGITYTIGSGSAKGEAYLTSCYTDSALSFGDAFYLRGGSTVNGYGDGSAQLKTVITADSDVGGFYYDYLSGGKWSYEGSLAIPMAASKTYHFISNYAQLNAWRQNGSNDAGKIYVLTADITVNSGNAADWASAPPAVSWSPKNFAGTFDGNGHSISGLYGQGFIASLNGTIKNLSIKNSYINKTSASGSFANEADDAQILNCYSDAIVRGTGNNVGGFVGSMIHSHGNSGNPATRDTLVLKNCHFAGEVYSLNSYVGGFVANQQSNHVVAIDCLNSGNVYGTGHTTGISGAVYNGSFLGIRCVNTGTVELVYSADDPNGTYKKGDKTGSYRAPITCTVESADGWAVVFDCHGINPGSNVSYWDVRASGSNYGTLNGQTNLVSGDFSKYVNAFLPSKARTVSDAMGASWGNDAKGIAIRYTPTWEDVETIGTTEELLAWANNGSDDAGQIIVLTADIALNVGNAKEWRSKAPAKTWNPKTFAGIFEGCGHTVSGLYRADKATNGFVAALKDGGQVNSLSVKNSYFSGSSLVGGIVGSVNCPTGTTANVAIRNCYSNAIVEGVNHCGGILGYGGNAAVTVTIAGCWNDGPVTITHSGAPSHGSGRYASGIVGNQESCVAILTNCLNSGDITAYRNVSGISNAVYNGKLTATNCINTGKITVTCNPADHNNDTSTKPHATVAVVSVGGTVSLNNCFGMESACVVDAFPKSSTSTGADASFAKGHQYYLLDKLSYKEWGAHWTDRSACVVAPLAFTSKFSSPNGFRFAENGDGTVTLIGYKGNANVLEIPASYKNMPVTAIGAYAFQMVNVNRVVIPASVTTIETNAFCDSSLVSIELPASVTDIGEEAFRGASGLTSVVIPAAVTEIGEATFYGCSSLESVTLHNGITAIGADAFHGCSALKEIDVSMLSEIADGIFMNCTALTTVTVSDALGSIGANAFNGCRSLMMAALPAAVTEVGAYAFHNCGGLTDVVTSENLVSLGEGAFKDCDVLSYVVLSDKITEIADELFYGCDALSFVSVPESVTSLGAYAFAYCPKLEKASIPDNVTVLREGAFRGCTALESVVIPEGVVTVGAYAFYGDESLQSVQLPESLKVVDSYAFHQCKSLGNVSYTGTDDQWAKTDIRTGNAALTGADRENAEPLPEVTTPPATTVIPDSAPLVELVGGEGRTGQTVAVELRLSRNTALSALKLAVSYDSKVLSLASVDNGAWMSDAKFVSNPSDGQVILLWAGAQNVSADGTLASLLFIVADDAEEGNTAVSVEVLEAANAVGQDVPMKTANGKVSVTVGIPGDVNGDDEINGADSILLLQYLAEWDVGIDEVGADCNGDGEINGADSILLLQYLAEWDVTLG